MDLHYVRKEKYSRKKTLETLEEDEEYETREVDLHKHVARRSLSGGGSTRKGRDVIIAIDHGPNSKHAFDWAMHHFCRVSDTVHLLHAVSDVRNRVVYEMTEGLMEKLTIEASRPAVVNTVARIVEGDPGKVICREAVRLQPAAVIMGSRGKSLIQSVLQGSVVQFCLHNCKVPVIIVPGKAEVKQLL